jgi:membrane protein involved in D-alanine export
VIPYADFTYFGLLLYAVVPTLILGLFGKAGWRWATLVTAAMLIVQYHGSLDIRPHFAVREIWIVIGFAVWQWATVCVFAKSGARAGWPFYVAVAAGLLPLAASKFFPIVSPKGEFGFLGISYITFRALDVVFCLRDKVIALPGALDFSMFLFFFPTISAGPIDRFQRFAGEWRKRRTRAEFLIDLDGAVQRIFRGFFYKFILAALIKQYWMERAASSGSFAALVSYMYAYSFYLFFDFAGYSAFAIAVSYLFGVHTPENFNRPFLARNIRDFWNRWHITLSFWFRDHVYMRFLYAAMRGKWFAHKEVAPIVGYFLAFGLMGLWHGPELHYIAYGFYQAVLLSAFHIFSRWSKMHRSWRDGVVWRFAATFITFQCVCFGLLIFSGRIGAAPLPHFASKIDHADCTAISGWVWDKNDADAEIHIELWDRDRYVMAFTANQFREDLVDAGYGNGRHAFRIPTPPQFRDQHHHVIHLRVAGTTQELTDSPRVIRCP